MAARRPANGRDRGGGYWWRDRWHWAEARRCTRAIHERRARPVDDAEWAGAVALAGPGRRRGVARDADAHSGRPVRSRRSSGTWRPAGPPGGALCGPACICREGAGVWGDGCSRLPTAVAGPVRLSDGTSCRGALRGAQLGASRSSGREALGAGREAAGCCLVSLLHFESRVPSPAPRARNDGTSLAIIVSDRLQAGSFVLRLLLAERTVRNGACCGSTRHLDREEG